MNYIHYVSFVIRMHVPTELFVIISKFRMQCVHHSRLALRRIGRMNTHARTHSLLFYHQTPLRGYVLLLIIVVVSGLITRVL